MVGLTFYLKPTKTLNARLLQAFALRQAMLGTGLAFNSLFCLLFEKKSMTPQLGNIISLRSYQQLPILTLAPLKGF